MALRAGPSIMLVLVAVGAAGCAADLEPPGTSTQAIIGGESTEPGEYPATGALVHGRRYRCTATLIAPDTAITAAHCLVEGGFGDFGFTLDPDLTDSVDDIVPVLLYHQHPDFDGYSGGEDYTTLGKRNDIAVVILAQAIEGVPVERLDDGSYLDELPDGTQLTLCGYGRDQWSVPTTAGVKRDGVVFVDHSASWELQTMNEDPQPCKGDSGAPLYLQTDEGRLITGLVARASGLSAMCDTGAINTRVAPYRDWIEEASLDRDRGCIAGGTRSDTWLILLAWLAVAAGRTRWRGRTARRSG